MTQQPDHDLHKAVTALMAEHAGQARYRRAQREATSGRGAVANGARPLEFDERGFPIPQRGPGFASRVARLLAPR